MAPGTISLEMKTWYAYESILFYIVADGRHGVHGQIDIRNMYTSPPGPTPRVTPDISGRMMNALDTALSIQSNVETNHVCEPSGLMKRLSQGGDFVVGSQCADGQLLHFLGPSSSISATLCADMILTHVMMEYLGHKQNLKLHCT